MSVSSRRTLELEGLSGQCHLGPGPTLGLWSLRKLQYCSDAGRPLPHFWHFAPFLSYLNHRIKARDFELYLIQNYKSKGRLSMSKSESYLIHY
jgi:hypothetical protein